MNFQDKLFNQTQDKLAETISALMRSINDKEKSVEFLTNLKDVPSIDTLQRINKIATDKEDYETCEALKSYSIKRGITL